MNQWTPPADHSDYVKQWDARHGFPLPPSIPESEMWRFDEEADEYEARRKLEREESGRS